MQQYVVPPLSTFSYVVTLHQWECTFMNMADRRLVRNTLIYVLFIISVHKLMFHSAGTSQGCRKTIMQLFFSSRGTQAVCGGSFTIEKKKKQHLKLNNERTAFPRIRRENHCGAITVIEIPQNTAPYPPHTHYIFHLHVIPPHPPIPFFQEKALSAGALSADHRAAAPFTPRCVTLLLLFTQQAQTHTHAHTCTHLSQVHLGSTDAALIGGTPVIYVLRPTSL